MPARMRVGDPIFINKGLSAREARIGLEGLFTAGVDTGRAGLLAQPNPVGPTSPASTRSVVQRCHVAVSRAGQGVWVVPVESATELEHQLPAASARIDLVVARVYDTEAGNTIPADVAPGGTQTGVGVVEVITGTPGGGAPALPAGATLIRQVTMPAGTGSVLAAGAYAVEGPVTVARGGVLPVHNQAEQDAVGPYEFLVVGRRDTGNIEARWNGVWRRIATLAGRTAWTPALRGGGTQVALGTGGVATGRAHIVGKEMDATWSIRLGSTGVNGQTGDLTLSLPAGVSTASSFQMVPCKIYVPNQARHYMGVLEFAPGSTSGTIIMPGAFNDVSGRAARNTDPATPTTAGTGIPKIDAAAGGPDFVLQNNGSLYASGRIEIA